MTPRGLPPGRGEPKMGSVAPHGIGGYLSPSFYFFTRAVEPASHRFYATNRPAQGFRYTGSAGTVSARMKATARPMCADPAPAQLRCEWGNSSGTGVTAGARIQIRSTRRRRCALPSRGSTPAAVRLREPPGGLDPRGQPPAPHGIGEVPPCPDLFGRFELAKSPFFIEPYGDSRRLIAGFGVIAGCTKGFRAPECGES